MNISFSLTKPQIRDQSKTVTRRNGPREYTPGQIIQAVEKVRGLKKGEHVKPMAKLRIRSTRWERLDKLIYDDAYGQKEVIREGFPDMTPLEFVEFFCATHKGCTPKTKVNRIEFDYVEEENETPYPASNKSDQSGNRRA